MRAEYVALRQLEESYGYKALQALWVHQLTEIESARDRAAKRGGESAWRYWAGQEMGFKLAMTALSRAFIQMEKEDENLEEQSKVESLLSEIRGDMK